MAYEKRYCYVCDDEMHGRKDQRFCSDYCRARYHNKLHQGGTAFMRSIQYILRKNRYILMSFAKTDHATVIKKVLRDQGFRFEYHTHHCRSREGKTYFFCYDYGFADLGHGKVELIKKEIPTDLKGHAPEDRNGIIRPYQKENLPMR